MSELCESPAPVPLLWTKMVQLLCERTNRGYDPAPHLWILYTVWFSMGIITTFGRWWIPPLSPGPCLEIPSTFGQRLGVITTFGWSIDQRLNGNETRLFQSSRVDSCFTSNHHNFIMTWCSLSLLINQLNNQLIYLESLRSSNLYRFPVYRNQGNLGLWHKGVKLCPPALSF